MIFKFYFVAGPFDLTSPFIECNANSMKEFSDRLASEENEVLMKLKILGLEEGQFVKNVGLFLTEASSLGTAENLVQGSLESQKNEILSFADDTGLYIKRVGESFEQKKFTVTSGNNLNSRLLLTEDQQQFSNGSEIVFTLRFAKSNQHENRCFFVGLEAEGDYV